MKRWGWSLVFALALAAPAGAGDKKEKDKKKSPEQAAPAPVDPLKEAADKAAAGDVDGAADGVDPGRQHAVRVGAGHDRHG